jgi:hypothetical protein
MKTQLLITVGMFFLLFNIAEGQNVSFDFKVPDPNPPGITIEDKGNSEDKEFIAKKDLIKKSVEKAIRDYEIALSDRDHPLNKTIGIPNQRRAQRTLSGISFTIWILEENDPQKMPMTFKLPVIFAYHNQSAYILKIPRDFMEKAKKDIRFEHLAVHEVAHVVNGDFEAFAETDDLERERKAEYLVYLMIGYERYTEALKQVFNDNEDIEGTLENFIRKWMMLIGVEDKDGKPVLQK